MATNVLVVDSDTTSCEIVSGVLQSRYPDTTVTEINDGEEAIKALTEHGDYVDAIIIGTELSTIDGWELLYVIKDEDNWPGLPVVVMVTEASMWEDSLKAHTLGANHFISKSFNNQELFEVLDSVIEGEKV